MWDPSAFNPMMMPFGSQQDPTSLMAGGYPMMSQHAGPSVIINYDMPVRFEFPQQKLQPDGSVYVSKSYMEAFYIEKSPAIH